MIGFEELLKTATIYLAIAIEAGAAIIIAYAAADAGLRMVASGIRTAALMRNFDAAEGVRTRLGRGLSLALEFEVAADILRAAVAPSWTQIGQLAAIIALRTALNFFLQREIRAS